MFAYCNNNPVNYADPTGHRPVWEKRYGSVIMYTDTEHRNHEAQSNDVTYITMIDPGKKPPDSPNFKPPKGGNRRVRDPNGSGKGWLDKKGNVWVWTPNMHGGEGWTVQYPNGGHHHEYPDGHIRGAKMQTEYTPPTWDRVLGGLVLAIAVVADDFVGVVADDPLLAGAVACFVPSYDEYYYCEVCGQTWK